MRDAGGQGKPKVPVLLGDEVSDEPSMESSARNLRMLLLGARVNHIPMGQPLRFVGAEEQARKSLRQPSKK